MSTLSLRANQIQLPGENTTHPRRYDSLPALPRRDAETPTMRKPNVPRPGVAGTEEPVGPYTARVSLRPVLSANPPSPLPRARSRQTDFPRFFTAPTFQPRESMILRRYPDDEPNTMGNEHGCGRGCTRSSTSA